MSGELSTWSEACCTFVLRMRVTPARLSNMLVPAIRLCSILQAICSETSVNATSSSSSPRARSPPTPPADQRCSLSQRLWQNFRDRRDRRTERTQSLRARDCCDTSLHDGNKQIGAVLACYFRPTLQFDIVVAFSDHHRLVAWQFLQTLVRPARLPA